MAMFIKSLGIVVIAAVAVLVLRVNSSMPSMSQTSRAEGGEITGRVLDARGEPIGNAIVFADAGGPSVSLPQALTNRNGEFQFLNLPPGVYTLHSRKEDDGYPRSEFVFYDEGENKDPQVPVYAGLTTPNVIIQREKAAMLKGRVVDGTNGKPLKHADVWLRQVVHPDRFLRTGLSLPVEKGEFHILVPSVAFTVTVVESGYVDWHYRLPGERSHDGALLLAPESSRELDIVMIRKKPVR